MTSRIQVGIRLRPFLESEVHKGYLNSRVRVDRSNGGSRVSISSAHGIGLANGFEQNRVFEFDHIFEQLSEQAAVYKQTGITSMVARVIEGFHSTIFAYGQTGSGKTFTMEGKHDNVSNSYATDEAKGIVARSLEDLFTQIAKLKSSSSKTYNVTCSFLQIYNERIYDLLNAPLAGGGTSSSSSPSPASCLKLRWNAREQFQVENLFVFDVKTAREAQGYFLSGVRNRVIAAHKLNMSSSRSHTIFTVTLHTYSAEGAHETSSKLQLVDLAGSERIALTGTEGKIAKESIDINKSLFTLRQVITALSELNQTGSNDFNSTAVVSTTAAATTSTPSHIPYRDSKLTSLLKQSIGGNSYCLMIACIVPNDAFVDENVSTLHYATKATYIKNLPVKNEDPNKQILGQITCENTQLKQELDKANTHIQWLTQTLKQSEAKCEAMQRQIEAKGNINDDSQHSTAFAAGSVGRNNSQPVQQQQVAILSVNQSQESFNERLIESITLVRQLLQSNKELRQQTDEVRSRMRSIEGELSDLTRENQLLVEQLERKKLSRKLSTLTRNASGSGSENRTTEHSESSNEGGGKRDSTSVSNDSKFSEYSRDQLIQEILAMRKVRSGCNLPALEKILPKHNSSSNGNSQQINTISPNDTRIQQSRNPSTSTLQQQSITTITSARQSTAGGGGAGFGQNQAKSKRANSLHPRQLGSGAGVGGVSQIFPFYQEEFVQQTMTTLNGKTMTTGVSGQDDIQLQQQVYGSDSVPTNFGRYTFYQQGFTHFDMRQQQNTLGKVTEQSNNYLHPHQSSLQPLTSSSQKSERRKNVEGSSGDESMSVKSIQTAEIYVGNVVKRNGGNAATALQIINTNRPAATNGRSISFTKTRNEINKMLQPNTLNITQHSMSIDERAGGGGFSSNSEEPQQLHNHQHSINTRQRPKPFIRSLSGNYN